MSHPDYEQTTHDHAALLVLLKPIGTTIKQNTIQRLCERIVKSGSKLTIVDSSGGTREILIRFVREHPVENNDWGDFQTHRRLLGLITFGKYDHQIELNELCRLHETLKVKYNSTLYDSRAILFGPSDVENIVINEPPNGYTTPTNFKTLALFYSDEICQNLEAQIMECLHSLFWILESKRLEKSREKIDKVPLLLAPFEKKDFIGLDLESRINKKKSAGRMTKNLGDLCLQVGLYNDAIYNYNFSINILQSVNDWLWLGGAYEGLCAASSIILYPNLKRSFSLQRNSSLQEGSPGKQRRGSQAINNVTLPLPPSFDEIKLKIPNILSPEEIPIKYSLSIVHYSKYQNAGIIETEASFKATKISIEQNCIKQAASFLNNVVFNNMEINEQEKIDRFIKLSELYSTIGFLRKSSFCMRLAATRYISPKNPQPDWNQCYNFMLQSCDGFKLSLDPIEMTNNCRKGWPSIQIQILNELIIAANRMGNAALATRHMTFLLETMFNYLSQNERKDIALQLQGVAQQCEGAPVPLVLKSGIVIPPANLTNIPQTKLFLLNNLKPHLQPKKILIIKEDHGPFLFTPINFGSLERKNITSKSKVDYLWIEDDICEVTIQLCNPLPFELNVSNMRLLTSGIVFESLPTSITLPPKSGPISITLTGTPKETGDLEILGFITHTLGVKSNCRLKNMENMKYPLYTVEVIPVLPKIDLSTSLPKTASFSCGENIVTSASISLYGGESAECTITIKNISKIQIDMIDISIKTILDNLTENKIFKWSDENLKLQLPLQPDTSASFTLYLFGDMNFILQNNNNNLNRGNNLIQSGTKSLPTKFNSSTHHTKRQSGLTSSMRAALNSTISSNQNQSNHHSHNRTNNNNNNNNNLKPPKLSTPLIASNIIEGQLNIKYSGGSGFNAGYCRISSVSITIEMLPSLQITSWDVLPAETPSQFYLVLDVTNMTNQEMELHYTQNKSIYMEGRESCRIPVPVNRCPLNKLTNSHEIFSNNELQKICAEHIASLVDLKWQLLGTDLTGKASLNGITFTQDMLDLVRMSPLEWEVVINDIAVKPQDEITCGLGECVSIGVGVCNALEHPLSDLSLSIDFYQDHHNGVNNYRLDTRLSIAGANKVMLPTLQEYGRAYHECRVVFFTAGQYKIDIQCCSQKSLTHLSNENALDSGHIWRYIPPIEIAVDDC